MTVIHDTNLVMKRDIAKVYSPESIMYHRENNIMFIQYCQQNKTKSPNLGADQSHRDTCS